MGDKPENNAVQVTSHTVTKIDLTPYGLHTHREFRNPDANLQA